MEFPTPTLNESALETLEAQITEVWGHINSATCRFLELLAEFDRSRGWGRHGLADTTQWLSPEVAAVVKQAIEAAMLAAAAYNRRRGVTIDAKTTRCGWRGEVMDYGLAIEALCWESGLRI